MALLPAMVLRTRGDPERQRVTADAMIGTMEAAMAGFGRDPAMKARTRRARSLAD